MQLVCAYRRFMSAVATRRHAGRVICATCLPPTRVAGVHSHISLWLHLPGRAGYTDTERLPVSAAACDTCLYSLCLDIGYWSNGRFRWRMCISERALHVTGFWVSGTSRTCRTQSSGTRQRTARGSSAPCTASWLLFVPSSSRCTTTERRGIRKCDSRSGWSGGAVLMRKTPEDQ